MSSVLMPTLSSAVSGVWSRITKEDIALEQQRQQQQPLKASNNERREFSNTYDHVSAPQSTLSTPVSNQRPIALDYPDCPAEYKLSSSAAVLCVMWVQLAQLETAVGTVPQNGFGYIPVTCQFSDFDSKIVKGLSVEVLNHFRLGGTL